MSEANNLNTKNDITLNSSNNSTHNDSIAILKKNISSLLKEKGMNQKALANAIGSTQPRVSKCLDLETKRLFYCLSATAHCTIFTNFHRCLVWIFSHPGIF